MKTACTNLASFIIPCTHPKVDRLEGTWQVKNLSKESLNNIFLQMMLQKNIQREMTHYFLLHLQDSFWGYK